MQTYESDANIGNIKILAVDMDKTLLTDERVLPQGLDERLDKLAEAGIVFCPASGRPAPKLEEMFEGIKNRLAFCPDNGACVIYRGSYIYKSIIDVELYQQVLSRASEDPRAVPVLCCFDEFYVLARRHDPRLRGRHHPAGARQPGAHFGRYRERRRPYRRSQAGVGSYLTVLTVLVAPY